MVADKNKDKPIVKILGVRMPSGATMWMVAVSHRNEFEPAAELEDQSIFKLFQSTNAAVDFVEKAGYRPMICNGANAGTNNPRERFKS